MDPGHDGWFDLSKQYTAVACGGSTSMRGLPAYVQKSGLDVSSNWLTDSLSSHWEVQTDSTIGVYSISPSYININCSVPKCDRQGATLPDTAALQSVTLSMKDESAEAPVDTGGNIQRSFEMLTRWNAGGISVSGAMVCSISQATIDVQVRCSAAGCIPQFARWFGNGGIEKSTSYKTEFDDPVYASSFLGNFTALFAGQQNSSYFLAYIQKYHWLGLRYSDRLNGTLEEEGIESGMHVLLTPYFNTYREVSRSEDRSDGTVIPFEGGLYDPHYAISWGWLAVDCLSSLMLLAAAIASVYFRLRTLAPDILGSVSSLTRDNMYMNLPDGGSTLAGLQRTRLLKNVRVKLCDVSSKDDDVGRIGLLKIDGSEEATRPLNKRMRYA